MRFPANAKPQRTYRIQLSIFAACWATHIEPHESDPQEHRDGGETFRRTQLACGWPSAHCLPCAPDFTTWISPLVLALF
jgi:hypothetical protein